MKHNPLPQTSGTGERRGPLPRRVDPARRRRRKRQAQIQLPPLQAEEALLLVNVLDKAVMAIWRAHGPAMQEHLEATLAGSLPKPPDAVWCGNADQSLDMPF